MSNQFDRARCLAESGISGSKDDTSDVDSSDIEAIRRTHQGEKATALFSLFNSLGAASESVGEGHERHIRQATERLSTDPELMADFLSYVDLTGEMENEAIIAEIQDQLMTAADPYTGVVPSDFELASELQAYFDESSQLQEFRRSLPELLGVQLVSAHDRTRAALKKRATEVTTWFTPVWPQYQPVSTQLQWVVARSAGDQSLNEEESRGEIDGSDWMLERRLVEAANGNSRVEFRLVHATDGEDVYAHYEDWDMQVYSGEEELEVVESLYDEEVRELKSTYTGEQLQTHRVIVTRFPE